MHLAAIVVLVLCYAVGKSWQLTSDSQGSVENAGLKQEIERVQNGLLPAAVVKGSPSRDMTLADRMFTYHVTGVSIAVIHNSAIRWSRGFGTLKVGGAPVTADTLFQAASVSKPVTAVARCARRQLDAEQLS
ncbi:MAG: serine hydrolase domain-containing protein [Candidatus Sulfotelmatobacter sp.]